jgi:signal transduction histidine kinase/DNA-binding NarL/FixJ family response regulator
MSSPGLKFSAQPMPKETTATSAESIASALLELEGYAAFEYLGDAQFQLIGPPTRFSVQLSGKGDGARERLTDRMPFLESFLPDAEECWNSDAGDARVESGAWVETVDGGRELALEASAFRLAGRRILLIQNSQKRFAGNSALLQTARDAALNHERLLREIQKKEILLHCVIHDLSQPLSAMRGCFSLLAAENLPAKLQELIDIGQRQSRNQEELIGGILHAFSAELTAQDVTAHDPANAPDLAKCAQQIAADYSAAFAAKGARIEVDSKADLAGSWRVVGDESRLRRIYTNLVENALRYSPAGSIVTLGAIDEGKFVRAFVDDEGAGLPMGEQARRLFSLFAKGTEGGGKAGLGLYFCKITVERWGGTIGAENRPNRGTRFWFRLPRAEERAVEVNPPAMMDPPALAKAETKLKPVGRLRILLADDMPVNRRITSLLLEKQGHEVVAVENGRQALARFNKERFDGVILDEEMPEMGGLEAVREIRKQEAATGGHVPAILVTGNATDAARKRSREAGFDAHIAKPFEDEELFHTLADLSRVEHAVAVVSAEKPSANDTELDEQELLKRVGGNPKMLRDVAKIFVQDTPKRMSAIRTAIAGEDGEALATAAHALRGSVAMLGGAAIADEIRKIETLGRQGTIADAGKILASFEGKLTAFEARMAEIAGGAAKQEKAAPAGGGKRARRTGR